MARAETVESVGETGGGGGGNDPLPHHNTCRMELPRPFHSWPGLLAATDSGAMHLHRNPPPLHPLQALYLLPYPHPQGRDEPPNNQQIPAPSPPASPVCDRRAERGGGPSGQQPDSDGEELREAGSRQGPLPDLLPRNEHPSRASALRRAPRGEAEQELEVRRVANQLRTIGDEFNATILSRAHAAPHWQDWRDAYRGLLNFISQTLSAFYRLT